MQEKLFHEIKTKGTRYSLQLIIALEEDSVGCAKHLLKTLGEVKLMGSHSSTLEVLNLFR